MKKFLQSNFGISLMILAIIFGYFYFVSSVKADHYQLFNVKKTMTWAKSGNSLYRTHSHRTVENILLSEDGWRDYILSFKVANLKDCGFVFDYVDAQNYGFIYLRKDSNSILSGNLQQGQTQNVKLLKANLGDVMGVNVEKKAGIVSFTVNQNPIITVPSQVSDGKIGFLVNEASYPPMLFHQISINGILESGRTLSHDVNAKSESGLYDILRNFLPFYLAFVVFVICFPILFPRFLETIFILKVFSFLKYDFVQNVGAALVHLFLAGCFFWPFISRGEVAVFSYDNLGEIYPLFYYAKHNFMNILQGHSPWLWNSILQNGFPFYSNHWDMIYYPLNWLVFLFSEKTLLTALTLKSFVEVTALGIFAYGFFSLEFKNKRWALFSSVVYQMCSLLIFTMGIFPATSTYFAMTFYLYVLWSVPQRRALTNFLLLSFAVVLILTSANVAFIFYACLALAVITIYRFVSVGKEGSKLFALTAIAWLTGTLMCSVRILSCLQGVTSSNRMVENFHTLHDRAYMAIRLFVPEIAGWMGPDALNVLMSPNLKFIFQSLELPSSNPQNSFFVYFGVVPALLLIVSFLITTKGKHTFWKIYSVIALGVALLWQPIWGVLSILCLPLNHYSYHAIILPVGICALIGYTGMAWELKSFESVNFRRYLTVAIGLVVAYFFVFVTYLFPSLASLTRIIFLLIGLAIAIYYVLRYRNAIIGEKFLRLIGGALNVLILALLIIVTIILVVAPIPKKEDLGTTMVLPFLWIAAASALMISFYYRRRENSNLKVACGLSLIPPVLALLASVGFVISPLGSSLLGWEQSLRVYSIDILVGYIRLLLLLQIGILGFSGIQKKIFSVQAVFAVLLIFTMMDLVVFNARFNNITAPFYYKKAFYPKDFTYKDLSPDFRKQMDLVNYRASHLHHQDFNANKNLVFDVPSYSGTVGYMTKRFSKLLTSFGYPDGIYMLYPEDSTENARFQDLSAIRYVFEKNGQLTQRPSALGRLNLVFSGEVIEDDDKMLSRLQEESFDPHKSVLFSQPLSALKNLNKDSIIVPITKATPNRIESRFDSAAPSYMLFSESYDEGWKAFVDNVQVPVLRANYNFMACVILTAGSHEIRFVYDPPQYKRNLLISLFGLTIFVFAALVAFWRRLFAVK
ncbi:MAG: hypothetical protein H6754_00215 [Candidatus Omnitrophica bacterium]|nr:hypothetical protein [Candidatus Omnitrophota bacterium]